MESHSAHNIFLVSYAQYPKSAGRQVSLNISCNRVQIVLSDVFNKLPGSHHVERQGLLIEQEIKRPSDVARKEDIPDQCPSTPLTSLRPVASFKPYRKVAIIDASP